MKQLRLTRILKLLETLQSGVGRNADSLAKMCGVSRRTVFRDLQTLKTAGVPLQFDRELDRYSLDDSFTLPPTEFTAEEALAIIALSQEIGTDGQLPFYEHAHTAARKLLTNLPLPLQKELAGAARSIRIQLPPVNPLTDKWGVYRALVDSASHRRAVRIEYESLTEWETIATTLHPYKLLFSRHSWYVVGRSSMHRQIRTFNVGRIAAVALLDRTFSIPNTFSIEKHLRNAWHLIPEPGPDARVTVRFQPFVARNVAEVAWHKTQRCEFLDDGAMDFHVTVSGLNEIAWWILGYGDQAEVLRPIKLRRLIAERARRLLARYEEIGEKHVGTKL